MLLVVVIPIPQFHNLVYLVNQFLKKYFHFEKVIEAYESLVEAWDKFQDLLRNFPSHGLDEYDQM